MPEKEIEELKDQFVDQLEPLRIYLFGSFASGTYKEDSDFDFYIVVDDRIKDLKEMTTRAYCAIRRIKNRPVDIVVGTESRFESRKNIPSVENEVLKKGVLLHESEYKRMD